MTEATEPAEQRPPGDPPELAGRHETEADESSSRRGPSSPSQASGPLRYDQRPTDDTPVHTEDLPPTPLRDRNIPATAWVEAPDGLLRLGDDLPGRPVAEYKRRIGPWLLWRAGPASGADARYWVARADDLATSYTFRLFPDGTGEGTGPTGTPHTRFRTWKEDLRDAEA